MTEKPPRTPDALTPRDKQVCEAFASGETRRALAERFALTKERIGQILNKPASVQFLQQRAGVTKALIFTKAGEEILARMEWGGMKLADLIAVWKAAMPQETTLNVNILVRREAERLAAEMGLDPAEILAEAEAIVQGAS